MSCGVITARNYAALSVLHPGHTHSWGQVEGQLASCPSEPGVSSSCAQLVHRWKGQMCATRARVPAAHLRTPPTLTLRYLDATTGPALLSLKCPFQYKSPKRDSPCHSFLGGRESSSPKTGRRGRGTLKARPSEPPASL